MNMKTERHTLLALAILICSITLALPAIAQEERRRPRAIHERQRV